MQKSPLLIIMTKMVKRIFLLTVLLAVFAFPLNMEVQAAESSASSGIKVDKVSNVLDRFSERVHGWFKFSGEDKANYQLGLIEKRLAELQYVIDDGQGDLIEEVSSRYATYVGRFSDDLIPKKLSAENAKYLVMFESHLKILPELRDHFPSNSGWWLLLQHDINTVQIFSDKIKNFK